VNKDNRKQHVRNVRYRIWRRTKAIGNKLDDGTQWLFYKVFLPIGSLNRWPRVAHAAYVYRPHITVSIISAMWLGHAVPAHHHSWVSLWLESGPTAAFLVAFWLSIVGDIHVTPHGTMCERCLDMSFPADGEAQAEAKMNRLRFFHHSRVKWNRQASWLMLPWLVTMIGYDWWIPWYANLSVWTLIMLNGAFVSVWCERPHRKLRYWCPWCREGDGAFAPEPELDRAA